MQPLGNNGITDEIVKILYGILYRHIKGRQGLLTVKFFNSENAYKALLASLDDDDKIG